VLEGLRGARGAANERGQVTWDRLVPYVKERVKAEFPGWFPGLPEAELQRPHAIANLTDDPVLVRLDTKKGSDGPRDSGKVEIVKTPSGSLENTVGMRFVLIPRGNFTMGSPRSEARRLEEESQHGVTISEFRMSAYEVTQKQFRLVMGYNPSYFSRDGTGPPTIRYGAKKPGGGKAFLEAGSTDDHPVENVSWDEADEFCRKLSAKEKGSNRRYRLPTEAEWEYACRGNPETYQVFHYGDTLSGDDARFDGSHPYGGRPGEEKKSTCKVGSYKPNAFGLYDMHGNVKEWCADWYTEDYYNHSDKKDPWGPVGGKGKVFRGGCWAASGADCRSARRDSLSRMARNESMGFRVVLVLEK
jgi:formylglycine-generating enzyme required for sulfatase activity